MRGSESLAVINQVIATAGEEINSAHRRLEELNGRLADANRMVSEAYRDLARFRLGELAAGEVLTQLDGTERALLALLERRADALASVENNIAQLEEKLSAMAERRSQAVSRRDDLVKQVDESVALVKADLELDEGYRAQKKILSAAAARAGQAQKKADRADTDREEKGRPYRDDPKFMYLWQRRYLTPDYSGSGIIRMLDGWVAKLIGYADARSNYFLLTELPLRLRRHAEKQALIARSELEKIHALEAEAMKDPDLIRKKSELQAAQKSLEDLDAAIEAEERQIESLLRQRSDFSNARDEYSQQAIQLQVSELKNDSIENLQAIALKTPEPDDDVSVSRIRDLERQKKALVDEINRVRREEAGHRSRLEELDELRRRFRRRNYDSRHSYFPGGFDLAVLLGRILAGSMSGGGVWDQIRRNQRFRRPRTPRDFGGGIFPGGFGGPGRGGGFGGGFGGGGGFKTGGGF